ncbi:MAG: polymerase LigD, ligase domain protein [Pedosphaera sp.]|nr:polymerase LigD, ligase domain protein [Pedosphaera sp.]
MPTGLKTYRAKRNFTRTAEPAGQGHVRSTQDKAPIFVVQKHAASHLHYDFRLEMNGVLKSWAVPKGFPTRKGERRLAVEVEDHPLDYANFEGTIPAGNYGGGTVMVWDRGTFQVLNDDPLSALKDGKLRVALAGTKLKGEWTLVRMRSAAGRRKPQWLLIKSGSDAPPISARAEDQSALTQRTLKQIATTGASSAKSKRKPSPSPSMVMPAHSVRETKLPSETRGLPRAKPAFVPPMKCELVRELPKGREWIYEIKFDGVRALAIKEDKSAKLISRSEKELSAKYPQLTEAVAHLPCRNAVLDGEIVAIDAQGRSSFQLLQSYNMPGHEQTPIFYYAFDLLNLEGRDLTRLPLMKRKEMLKSLLASAPESIRFSAGIEADSAQVVREMKARGLEGLVAKRRDSLYEPGQRTGAWVKFKWSNEQEFVIGGYTPPKGTRAYFGAILVGYYEGKQLMFASKVGTGFNHELLESLYGRFQKLVRRKCPFANLPTPRTRDASLGLTGAQMRHCTWLEPCLVCQLRFSEWTRDGHLRQPVFLGLREDKCPTEVVRERPK